MGLELIYFKNYKNVFLPSKCTFIYFTLVLALCALHSGMLLPTLGQIQFYSWLFAIWNSKILKHSWHYWKPCLHDHVLSWEEKNYTWCIYEFIKRKQGIIQILIGNMVNLSWVTLSALIHFFTQDIFLFDISRLCEALYSSFFFFSIEISSFGTNWVFH